MITVEITMPYNKIINVEYDDVSVEEAMESFESLYEIASQDRLQYVTLPVNTCGKKTIIPVEIFKQCIIEVYNA